MKPARRWQVELSRDAERDLRRLAAADRTRVLRFLRERIAADENPRRIGHALTGDLAGLWSYRVGNMRVVATIEDKRIRILVLRIGNRREIYR
jgi:mRNA interferase RelE/StbE